MVDLPRASAGVLLGCLSSLTTAEAVSDKLLSVRYKVTG